MKREARPAPRVAARKAGVKKERKPRAAKAQAPKRERKPKRVKAKVRENTHTHTHTHNLTHMYCTKVKAESAAKPEVVDLTIGQVAGGGGGGPFPGFARPYEEECRAVTAVLVGMLGDPEDGGWQVSLPFSRSPSPPLPLSLPQSDTRTHTH